MKKFFITLLFIITAAATAFFFGWANFSVPPGSYGIIISKTHGTYPNIIQSGEFQWIWYKLIPTNVNLSVYKLDTIQYPINFNSSLPSADTYANFVGLSNTDFSWELTGYTLFSVNPEHLLEITSQNNITDQEGLDSYLQDTAEKIKLKIINYLGQTTPEQLELILGGGQDSALKEEILRSFWAIKDFSFVINTAKIPDFVLYTEIRAIYEEFLTKQREYITSSFAQRAENHIENQLRFAELERYGELLTKYPLLLDYLLGRRTN